jgi:hypothetical protein
MKKSKEFKDAYLKWVGQQQPITEVVPLKGEQTVLELV